MNVEEPRVFTAQPLSFNTEEGERVVHKGHTWKVVEVKRGRNPNFYADFRLERPVRIADFTVMYREWFSVGSPIVPGFK